jgi:hypothetical protein
LAGWRGASVYWKYNSQNRLKTDILQGIVALNMVQLYAFLKDLRAGNRCTPSSKKQLFIFEVFGGLFAVAC